MRPTAGGKSVLGQGEVINKADGHIETHRSMSSPENKELDNGPPRTGERERGTTETRAIRAPSSNFNAKTFES